MTDILSLLPEELRALHFEEEVDALSRQIRIEEIRGRLSVLRERKRTVLPARTRSAAPSARGSASGSRIHHDDPQRSRR